MTIKSNPPFYKCLDSYLFALGGGCMGWGGSHYFTGSATVASLILALGVVLSIGGLVTSRRHLS